MGKRFQNAVFLVLYQLIIWHYNGIKNVSAQSQLTFQQSFPNLFQGPKCSGYCTDNIDHCRRKGGNIIGFCNNYLACCDPLISGWASCGDARKGRAVVYFTSPGFPNYARGDLVCEAKVEILPGNIATRVDFILAEMDGPAFLESEDEQGMCESDMILFKGFATWTPPPRCGNLTGYSFLIDGKSPLTREMKTLSILGIMSSSAYRWQIRVVQILRKQVYYENSVYQPSGGKTPYIWRKSRRRSLLWPLHPLNVDSRFNLNSKIVATSKRTTTVSQEDSLESVLETPLVLNGQDANSSSSPWQVSLRFNVQPLLSGIRNQSVIAAFLREYAGSDNCSLSEGIHFCGASIISEKYVLTAAHCFYGTSKLNGMVNTSTIKAVVGDVNLCTDDSGPTTSKRSFHSTDHTIDSVTIHYAYDGQLLINDLALVKLKNPISFKPHIQAITLAKTGDSFWGEEAIVSGWGEYLTPSKESEENEGPEEESTDSDEPMTMTSSTRPSSSSFSPVSSSSSPISMTSPSPISSTSEKTNPIQDTNFSGSESSAVYQSTTTTEGTGSEETKKPQLEHSTELDGSDASADAIQQSTASVFQLSSPQALQVSKHFVIQEQVTCNAKEVEDQYGTSPENIRRHPKYMDVFNSTLCTIGVSGENGEPPPATGKGDSGGPLVVMRSGQKPLLVGVVSYGIQDPGDKLRSGVASAQNGPTFDFYSSIAYYRQWIDAAILSQEEFA